MEYTYKDLCVYIYATWSGLSKIPFIVNGIQDNVIILSMIRDINFSLKAKVNKTQQFKIYAVPKQSGGIYNTTSHLINNRSTKYKSIIKVRLNITDGENMRYYRFDHRLYQINFWQHKMKDEYMFLSNPELAIRIDYLEDLIK